MTSRHVLALAALGLAATAGGAAAGSMEQRGQYLATIMDCSGCHTEGALAGKPDPTLRLAGSSIGFGAPGLGVFYPPNLTPDEATGLGRWSAADIVRAVRTGERPDGRMLAPMMPWHAYAVLTDQDAKALAAYLQSLPPVRHQVPAPVGPGETAPAPYLGAIMP